MYESYYGLTGKPFQLNPDPTFFYGSRGHKRALAYLQYGLYQGEGFIVITGEVGAGKTTLVRSLLDQLDQKRFVAAQLVSTQLDADDILRAVAHALGLTPTGYDKARLLAEIERYLMSLASEGKQALLIVDEAQNLTPRAVEELRMLSNFQVGDHALLQSFLIGQPELRLMMRSPHMQQLRQRVIASYHLGPMDRQETEAYIKHRLTRVGWSGDPEFDASFYDAVYTHTSGVPRRINTLCNRVMLSAYLSESHSVAAADVEGVVVEIKEELGDEAPPGAALNADGVGAHGVRSENTGEGMGEQMLNAGSWLNDASGASLARGARPAPNLEGRLERLEKAMVAALSALHRLIKPEQGQGVQTPAQQPGEHVSGRRIDVEL